MVQQACHAQSVWLLHAHGSSTSCALQDKSTLRLNSCRLLWHAIALINVALGEVGPCDEWLPLWVATQIMALTDATFLSCSSPYHSSHWIGRSTSGLRPCCCRRWFVSIVAIVASFWINEWRKNSQNKSQKWLMAQHMIYIIISSASWRSTVHDRHRISVLYSLSGAR